MNNDIFQGQWKQFRGRIKEWWGELTDDDLDRVAGRWDRFVGLLQERYGYTRERAEREVEQRWHEFDPEYASSPKP